jgi:NADPH-dependent curcumin reductase CurA
LRGFVVMDFDGQNPKKRSADLSGMGRLAARLKVREDIVDGFENLPAALVGLLAGDNVGKRMVKVV